MTQSEPHLTAPLQHQRWGDDCHTAIGGEVLCKKKCYRLPTQLSLWPYLDVEFL